MEDKDIILRQISGKTIVENEYHFDMEYLNKINIHNIVKVETIGMSMDKVIEQKRKIDKIVKDDLDLIKVCSFVNINGYSNLMNSDKYKLEINVIKTLSENKVKQSFVRLYWGVFKQVNEIQKNDKIMNYYQRKALKLGLNGDYTGMHFAFEFDPLICDNANYLRLKKMITRND